MVLNEDYMLHTENMKQNLRIETFYVKPPVNTDEILEQLDWYRRSDAPVKADLTDWNVSKYFPDLCNQLNVLYPNHEIQDLWVASMDVATIQKLTTILILIGLLCGIWMPVLTAVLLRSQT